MIKKVIPQKYHFQTGDLFTLIENIFGNVGTTYHENNRLIIIDVDATTEQKAQLKSDFLNMAEEVNEL